ncbi:VTT domain-containing protein [Paenibacillus sp. CC-CFT747]|nr:VTT domain-containing protein [Paenibacillus sp. CC-CFT747]
MSAANALVFGLPLGFAVSLAGEALGAYVSYWLYRKGIRALRRTDSLDGRWSRAFAEASPVRQFWLLLAARVAPFLPSGLITFAAAWTRMNVTGFMLATVAGKAPSVAAEIWAGHGLFAVLRGWL